MLQNIIYMLSYERKMSCQWCTGTCSNSIDRNLIRIIATWYIWSYLWNSYRRSWPVMGTHSCREETNALWFLHQLLLQGHPLPIFLSAFWHQCLWKISEIQRCQLSGFSLVAFLCYISPIKFKAVGGKCSLSKKVRCSWYDKNHQKSDEK